MNQQQTLSQFVEFQKNVKTTKKVFDNKPDSVGEDRIQTDIQFAQKIVLLKQKTQMLEQDVFAKRADLDDQEYEMIQNIGKLHYQCQLANESSSIDISKWPKQKKCVCGCNKASGQSLPYCTDIEDTTFFGPGVILFFFYSKRILILISFALLIYGVYALVTNIVGGQFQHDCTTNPNGLPFLCQWIRMASVKNKSIDQSIQMAQVWLAVPVCLFWAIGIRLLRNAGRRLNTKIDDKLDSSSDYCIWIEDLPSGKYHEGELVKYLAKIWRLRKKKNPKNPRMVIKSVQLIYKFTQISRIYSQIREKGLSMEKMYEIEENQMKEGEEQKKQKIYRVKEGFVEEYLKLKKEIDSLEDELKQYRKKFIEDSAFRQKITHETAIIEFLSPENCDEILENYGKFQQSKFREVRNQILSCFIDEQESALFYGKAPKIIRAPEPSDIIWGNAVKDQSMLKVMAVWGINLLLIGASFGSLMLFRYLSSISQTLKEAAFIKIIILNLFNRLIWNILNSVISIEENKTKTQQVASVMNKSYLGQSCNIIVLPLIMNLVFADNLYGPDGLSGAVHDYQLTTFLFMLLFNLVNIPHRLTQLLVLIPCFRRLLIKYFCRVTNDLNSLQEIKEALAFLYEPPKLPLAGFYVYIITITNQAFFFSHLQPINLFYLFGNLVIFFFINKFLLLKQCKIPDMLDFFIFESMIVMAMNVPLFYTVGSTVILAIGGQSEFLYYLPGIFCFIIWFLCSQNPFNIFSKLIAAIQDCFFQKNSQVNPQQNVLVQAAEKQKQDKNKSAAEFCEQKSLNESVSVHTNIRRENYYVGSPVTDLFNFENKIGDCIGPYHNRFRDFCEIFQFNMPKKKRKRILVEDI